MRAPITRLKPGVNEKAGVMFLMTTLVLLTCCQKTAVEPVALASDDMCSFCRMSISEKRYAAEFIDSEGQAFKFDEIGCMVNFIKQKKNKNQVSAYFVMDFDRREWIKAQDAVYVHSTEFATPMNGGTTAFKEQARAQVAAAKYHGAILRFDDLFN